MAPKKDLKRTKKSSTKKNGEATVATVADEEEPQKKKKNEKNNEKKSTARKKQTADVHEETNKDKEKDESRIQSQVPTVAASNSKGGLMVQKWVQNALDRGVDTLRQEYRNLAKYTYGSATYEAFKANHEAGRNRYLDVPCQDQHRVVLTFPGAATDYIHANYVGTPISEHRFICTQGPLDCTVNEFWMMVIQEEAETIVMLCNCIETGKYKCSQYWPEKVAEVRTIVTDKSTIEVTNKQMRALSPDEPTVNVTILEIKWKKDGETGIREVRHYQWQDWPDRGVPPCRLTSMELLSRVRGTSKPIIVHCSAGIGRTGTIVAIEYILERMQNGEEVTEMQLILKSLRDMRAYTIQNDLQYLYIHRVMLFYFLDKHRVRYENILNEGDNAAKYKKFVEEYNAATGSS